MINIIISGAPGSGKGTQSDLIVEKFRLKHLSTGDMLRAEIAAGTDLGRQVEKLVSAGHFVPDQMIIDIIVKAIEKVDDAYNGLILDGFPRTVEQAEALETIFEQQGKKISLFLDIHVDEAELIDRLLKRGQLQGRTDDNLETIRERLKVYHAKTQPISDFYKKKNNYYRIEGNGTVEEIYGKIEDLIHLMAKSE
ncbi:adenylate kinase [Bacteroidia bacterium]|nr:adenylate kinase [Bacteroidia bacterium]